jgi:hypothetical protein
MCYQTVLVVWPSDSYLSLTYIRQSEAVHYTAWPSVLLDPLYQLTWCDIPEDLSIQTFIYLHFIISIFSK